ncbi:YbhB/YbcL family Raf kinase inhibitor-like protein [candidate division WWE3 bacterium]|uniref:YbhB/YbcL family Raf kinase inhibitor-like protein n=1 Tax=candidate division WWE3 bacterium TaxID=2053526 RepID=A0A7X9DJG5_UNCKA|nr:YbhB/YbcL family Raf kinase inhibitor-like protein [candidate division WWE3 bacterium]
MYYLTSVGIDSSKIPLVGSANKPAPPKYPGKLILKSSAFENMGVIPDKYTCKGENINPPLEINDLPAETQSLVLILVDPDAPIKPFDHWVVFNINPKTTVISENAIPGEGILAQNSYGKGGYQGPCPVSGLHRYEFQIYALDQKLSISGGISKAELTKNMDVHVIDKGVLTGTFGK